MLFEGHKIRIFILKWEINKEYFKAEIEKNLRMLSLNEFRSILIKNNVCM